MRVPKYEKHTLSRRTFLKGMRYAPVLFVPAPIQRFLFHQTPGNALADSNLARPDFRITPHYPTKSPLDDVLRLVTPGSDEHVTEKYAFEITSLLSEWSRALRGSVPALDVLARFLDASIEAASPLPTQQTKIRSQYRLDVFRRQFGSEGVRGRERFLEQMETYLASLLKIETAEFEITGIHETAGSPLQVKVEIRYTLTGTNTDKQCEQRIGYWRTEWLRSQPGSWRARKWHGTEETISRAREPIFFEVTSQAFGRVPSYKNQMLRGVDHWRTVLDGACGIDVYGNNGIAVGDSDNDGFDDIYVCQPAGLPNRLYRNRGDGTFEDVTEQSGVAVLDSTACALFADFENKGAQDLLVVSASGPLLFLNQGNGKFLLKRDAFKFVQPPQGTFTHAAIADYDRDGHLDIYFCLYSYYAGLDQYRYPAPYFDARNGPPNFLFHNQGNATFEDQTQAAGLNADNDRYSFACAWGDCNSNGWPDLFVANDFGRSNLYRNIGDGTFTSVSTEAGVDDVGAGMSACWFDFDGDGNQDIYVANMWSAAGMRISEQNIFHQEDPEDVRALYRRHARGNSLYKNQGDVKFRNVSQEAGVEMGRWSWSSDAWDFDHDGYPDLYVANGYISGLQSPDLASFFWRQVVAKSPRSFTPSPNYERGWNAINELIRSDGTWNGYERNVLYSNNLDGTFSDISGISGLDFPDDSRAFALADLDHDGRLEVVLKNRNAPQLRILRNAMADIGSAVAFRLRGTKSNRDAIGSAVTVEAAGHRQTKYLQAGSGFLSQHTKDLFFGLGAERGAVRATIRWPSGTTQTFDHLPVNHRIAIVEGSEDLRLQPFATPPPSYLRSAEPEKVEPLPSSVDTWLIDPLSATNFSLPDAAGKTWELRSLRGSMVLLTFWAIASESSAEHLRRLQRYHPKLTGLQVLAANVDRPEDSSAVRSYLAKDKLPFPALLATEEVTGTYNIIFRYLFDRRRDLGIPTSFLIDEDGSIVKVYQGIINPEHLMEDLKSMPHDSADRVRKALPFAGTLHLGTFQRNDFTYGVAFFQRGYLDQAAESFKQVIASKPDDAEAYYNLGTLYLRRNAPQEARRYLEQTIKLKPNYAEAWNNLGMLAAQEGHPQEALQNFKQSLLLRPDYVVALLNLGNLYRRQKSFEESERLLSRALQIQPDDPEVNYSFGMLYAQQDQAACAEQYLQRAVSLRPDYPDALNNLGVLLIREQRYSDAEAKFRTCIQANPNFDQAYLNLARLYVILNDKAKARETLQALLRQQPQHKMALQSLEMLK
jgi:tetratricopeptide (TPR) repeat protein/peroxiredoxin